MRVSTALHTGLLLAPALLLKAAAAAAAESVQGFKAIEVTRKPQEVTTNMATNVTEAAPAFECPTTVPYMSQIVFGLGSMSLFRQIMVGANLVFFLCTVLVFVEACLFCKKAFKHNYDRRRRTMWICAFWPIMSLSGVLGILMPRSAPIVDLIAGAYLGSVLFQVVELLVGYMGGKKNMWAILGPRQKMIASQSLPFCCLFPCMPFYVFTRERYNRLVFWVFQLSIVRPLMMFVTAALWANGSYTPGLIAITNAFAYVKLLTVISTFSAMYSIAQIRNGFIPDLMGVNVIGKVTSVQTTVMLTVVIDIVISICLGAGAIPCTPIMPNYVNASNIFHHCLITICLPMALMGRKNYRCIPDAMWKPPTPPEESESMPLKSAEDGGDVKSPNGAAPPPGPNPQQKCMIFRP